MKLKTIRYIFFASIIGVSFSSLVAAFACTEGNTRTGVACSVNEGKDNQGDGGTKSQKCDSNKKWKDTSSCTGITSCKNSLSHYVHDAKTTCVKYTCASSETKKESCTKEISNSSEANKTSTCNSDRKGWTGTCTLVSCKSGYTQSENTCVKQVCSSSSGTVTLYASYSNKGNVASRTKKCENNNWTYTDWTLLNTAGGVK